jgi:hypothetical protein
MACRCESAILRNSSGSGTDISFLGDAPEFKHDRSRLDASSSRQKSSLTHSCEGGSHVARGAASQPGMNPNPCIEIWMGNPQDRRRSASRRQASDINSSAGNRKVVHFLTRDPGDERGFTMVASLVAFIEPVPAFRGIGLPCLRRVGN